MGVPPTRGVWAYGLFPFTISCIIRTRKVLHCILLVAAVCCVNRLSHQNITLHHYIDLCLLKTLNLKSQVISGIYF